LLVVLSLRSRILWTSMVILELKEQVLLIYTMWMTILAWILNILYLALCDYNLGSEDQNLTENEYNT